LLFDLASHLVGKFDSYRQRRFKRQIILFGEFLVVFWILKFVILESQFKFLTGVILDWVEFCEDLA